MPHQSQIVSLQQLPLHLLAGVSLFQYLEGMPDREAEELLRYHAGWNFALNRQVGDPGFHPTVLVYFRRRLIQADQSGLIFRQILEGLSGIGEGAITELLGGGAWNAKRWIRRTMWEMKQALKEATPAVDSA